MQQLRLDLVQQLLALVMLSQIANEADELPVSFEHYLADRKLHGEGAAILALADNDAAHADHAPFSGGEIMRQVAIVILTVRCRHQHAHVSPEHLAAGEAEEALRVSVEGLNHAFIIDDHNRIRKRRHDAPQKRLATLQFCLACAKFLVDSAQLLDDALLLMRQGVDLRPFGLEAHDFSDILDAVDHPLNLAVAVQDGGVQRAPILFLKTAVRPANVMSLDGDGVGPPELQHALQRGAKVVHGVAGFFWKYLE